MDRAAFISRISRREIRLPQGLVEMSKNAFQGCGLTGVRLFSALTTIHGGTFGNCTLLREMVLPNGIQSIEHSTFSFCKSLKHIVFPATLNTINAESFHPGCSLKTIKLCGRIQKIEVFVLDQIGLLKHFRGASKSLVVAKEREGCHFTLARDESIPQIDAPQVVVTSECFHPMPPADMSQLES